MRTRTPSVPAPLAAAAAALAASALPLLACALDNGAALTPPRGWQSWALGPIAAGFGGAAAGRRCPLAAAECPPGTELPFTCSWTKSFTRFQNKPKLIKTKPFVYQKADY